MKLTGIDAAKSKEGEIVFRTEPPMTEEVLQELPNVWILGYEFGIDGELLVWRGGAYPEKWFRQQTEIFLTEAENAVNAKKPEETSQHEAFLRKVSGNRAPFGLESVDNLQKAGWNCGCMATTDRGGRQFW